jgi:helicase MOV-10
MKPSLLEFCFYENEELRCPPVKALKRYNIVISTNMSSSTLWGLPEDHFTHIFLDDAGQCSEPETMVPLSQLCGRDTVVVVAEGWFGEILFAKVAL